MAFSEKKVLIVGGSSGIGLATAQAAVAAGAQVVITGRSEEKLAQAKALLGGAVETSAFDMTREQEVQAFFAQQNKTYDHLVVSSASPSAGHSCNWNQPAHANCLTSSSGAKYYVADMALQSWRPRDR